MIDERRFASPDELSAMLAADTAEVLAAAVTTRRQAFLIASGGRTPRQYLPLVARHPLEWRHILVGLTDDRWVESDQSDSNEGLVRRAFLEAGKTEARLVGMKTDHETPAEARAVCEARLSALPWPADVVLLGMGEDGHVASLFPDDPTWKTAAGLCHAVSAKDGRRGRMSLSPRALLSARRIFLVITGESKERTLRAALTPGSAQEIPARLVLCQDRVPVRIFFAPS